MYRKMNAKDLEAVIRENRLKDEIDRLNAEIRLLKRKLDAPSLVDRP